MILNITHNHKVFSNLQACDIGDIKNNQVTESETEVKVQYHLQKQDCQLLAASETGETENAIFKEGNTFCMAMLTFQLL